jgi:hypothetical protein
MVFVLGALRELGCEYFVFPGISCVPAICGNTCRPGEFPSDLVITLQLIDHVVARSKFFPIYLVNSILFHVQARG